MTHDEPDLDRIVSEQLNDLRQRLLDLTTRNRLLSTKFGKSSRREVRIIDELPDQLFERLNSGGAMRFEPLPSFDELPKDEKTPHFKSEIERLRLSDEDYLNKHRELDKKQADDLDYIVLEDELRVKARENLGLPQLPQHNIGDQPSLPDWARVHGLNPDFDVPLDSGEAQDRHKDNKIQLLLVPDQANRSLQAIYQASRSHLQETGLSVLFMAFGFLEWHRVGEQRHHFAPLILLPVSMERSAVPGRYIFKVQGDETDALSNITLKELLKQEFRINLSELDEDESPEKYWERIENEILPNIPTKTWKVRRFIAFGIFPYSSMAMFEDLNPDSGIGGSALVREILLGREGGGGGMWTEEYNIDDPEVEKRAPVLIMDADSSQHSAIIDVMDGKNLVIEGPPGTGKSQTITNLIGAALVEGKKVLFVAAKMAALEVVLNRLKACGLGDFVLELHAGRGSRKNVVSSLTKSINARLNSGIGGRTPPIEERRDQLNKTKIFLNDYVSAMNQPLAATGKSVHEVLWFAHELQDRLNLSLPLREIVLEDAGNITDARIDELRALIGKFSDQYNIVVEKQTEQEHPWYGVTSGRLDPFAHDRIEAGELKLTHAVDQLIKHTEDTSEFLRINIFPLNINELETAAEMLQELSTRIGPLNAKTIEIMSQPTTRGDLIDLAKKAQVWSEFDIALRDKTSATRKEKTELRDLAKDAALANYDNANQQDIEKAEIRFEGEINELEAVRTRYLRIASLAVLTDQPIDIDFDNLLTFKSFLKQTGIEKLSKITHTLLSNEAVTIMKELERESDKLQSRILDLSEYIDIYRIKNIDEAKGHLSIIAAAGTFAFVNNDYRAAKRFFRSLYKLDDKIDNARIVVIMEKAINLLRDVTNFANDEQGNALSPDYFLGIITDFGIIRETWDLQRNLKTLLERSQDSAPQLLRYLAESDTTDISLLCEEIDEHSFSKVKDKLTKNQTLNSEINRLSDERSKIQGLRSRAGQLGLAHSIIFADLDELSNDVEERANTYDELENDYKQMGLVISHDAEEIDSHAQQVRVIVQLIEDIPADLGSLLCKRSEEEERICQTINSLAGIRRQLDIQLDDLEAVLKINTQHFYRGERDECTIKDMTDRLRYAFNNFSEMNNYLTLQDIRSEITRAGLQEVIEVALKEGRLVEELTDIVHAIIRRSQIRIADEAHPSLLKYQGLSLDRAREEFRRLDQELLHLNRKWVAATVAQVSVPPGVSFGLARDKTELALIEHEVNKKKRFLPVRELFGRAQAAILSLKPCFMMSPQTVASFVRKDTFQFDLLIIDEASQLKPEMAIGVLARARQAIIVGDPKQLPPTTFFEKSLDDERIEDDESLIDEEDLLSEESILDRAFTVFREGRRLRWHYRSRHSGLIAFSNQQFYDNSLIVFPSAREGDPEYGVKWRQVDGLYQGRSESGSAGVNPIEAEEIASAAIDHMQHRASCSLGVVTMNIRQRDLIQELIDQQVLNCPAAQEYIKQWEQRDAGIERLFVKNLENVQGDERDVVMISTVYGPSSPGARVMQRFGPVNGVAGARRLNVLFTRAKNQVQLFTSLRPLDIQVNERTSDGARILRSYLEYAATGKLETGRATGRDPDSPFEEIVARVVDSIGCKAVAQIGVAGFYIDIGVQHPDYPYGFLLGVECDGATYHSGKSARDRDRLRQDILEHLGWSIYRIWSTDWWHNSLGEVERLRKAISGRIDDLKPEIELYRAEQDEILKAEDELRRITEEEKQMVAVGDRVKFTYLDDNVDGHTYTVQISESENIPERMILRFDHPISEGLLGALVGDEVDINLPGGRLRTAIIHHIEKREMLH